MPDERGRFTAWSFSTAVGVGYTLATGRLYCDFAAFQKFASDRLISSRLCTSARH
jgi:hypothetical protein